MWRLIEVVEHETLSIKPTEVDPYVDKAGFVEHVAHWKGCASPGSNFSHIKQHRRKKNFAIISLDR